MRDTAKGEYATQAVLHLSLQYPDVVTIHEVAERHHIPLKYLEQILLELKRGGILESRRGVRGGYTLARAPEEISVGAVLRVVDGAFAESSCVHNEAMGGVCVEGESCGLKQIWKDVQGAVEKILFATSFDEVRRRTLSGGARRTGTARLGSWANDIGGAVPPPPLPHHPTCGSASGGSEGYAEPS